MLLQIRDLINQGSGTYKDFMDSCPCGAFIIGLDGSIEHVNSKFTDKFGLKLEDVSGSADWPAEMFPDPEARGKVASVWDMAIRDEFKDCETPPVYKVPCPVEAGKEMYFMIGRLPDGRCLFTFEDSTHISDSGGAMSKLESWRRLIFNMSPDFIYILDNEGNFLDVNPALLKRIGMSLEEFRECHYQDFYGGDNLDDYQKAREGLRAGKEIKNFEIRARDIKGVEFDLEVSAIPLIEDSELAGTLSMARDITARKRAQEALRKSEERLRAIFETARDLIFIKDSNLRFTHANPEMERLFGFSLSELGQMTSLELFGEAAGERINEMERRVLAGEVTEEEQVILIKGKLVPFYVIEVPMRDDSGEIVGLCGIARNITKQKADAAELARLSQFLESIIDNANVFLDVIDENGNVIIWNKAAEEISGYLREEVAGQEDKIRLLLYPDEEYRERIEASIESMVKHGESMAGREGKIVTKSGEVKTISWHTRTLWKEGGESAGYIAIGLDITEYKKLQELKRYRELFENVRDIILVLDSEGGIIEANDAACELLGYDAARLKGLKLTDLVSSDQIPIIAQKLTGVIKEGKLIFETSFKVDSGKLMYVETSARAINFMDLPAILTVSRDITDRKEIERELARRNKELEAILYTASHDLKAPVFTIQGFSGLLLEKFSQDLPPRASEFVSRITNAAEQLQNMITDIVLIVRAEREAIHPEEISFASVLNRVWMSMEPRFAEQGVKFETAPDFPLVFADRRRLSQVLENLLLNALNFIGDNPDPKVEVGWLKKGESNIFYVRDNGIGIDLELHKRIFDPFYRIQEVDREGSGIGLALVKLIIEQHKGRIWVEAARGQGSAFYFTISEIY